MWVRRDNDHISLPCVEARGSTALNTVSPVCPNAMETVGFSLYSFVGVSMSSALALCQNLNIPHPHTLRKDSSVLNRVYAPASHNSVLVRKVYIKRTIYPYTFHKKFLLQSVLAAEKEATERNSLAQSEKIRNCNMDGTYTTCTLKRLQHYRQNIHMMDIENMREEKQTAQGQPEKLMLKKRSTFFMTVGGSLYNT